MIKIERKQISKDGTVKFLVRLENSSLLETVLMCADYGNSVCVSSQAGCNMGCKFCASGLLKKEYDLKAEEMLAQVELAQRELETKNSEGKITHVVVMGSGEPFDNYDEVIRFLDIITDEKKLKEINSPLSMIAPRHATVSTCGIIPKIYDFAKIKKRYQLAISLHAPNNEIRDELMPVNKKFPIIKRKSEGTGKSPSLLEAIKDYTEITGKRVTLEYILLKGINDSKEAAEELAKNLEGLDVYVNLIPFNGVKEFDLNGVSKEEALEFYDILMKKKIKATLRKERGRDIDAACGQLRNKVIN